MGLVTWIAIHQREIENLVGTYVDDSFGIEEVDVEEFYPPYAKFMPLSQVQLLLLWDDLGIPHKERKQISGSPLAVIGLDVDPNAMTITLPSEKKSDLMNELRLWASKPKTGTPNPGHFKLRQWQALAGWVNWGLNVYPLLRPCLNNLYPKISALLPPTTKVWINNAIRSDLNWAANHLDHLNGVQVLRATYWNPDNADVTIYCDACLEGMGFWYPGSDVGYFSPTPSQPVSNLIYYFETLCVTSAIDHVCQSRTTAQRIVIYTDNHNTVDIFSSLRCEPALNLLLRHAVDCILRFNHDIRVLHVPGKQNVVADAISRMNIAQALDVRPNLSIEFFQPPRNALGERQS